MLQQALTLDQLAQRLESETEKLHPYEQTLIQLEQPIKSALDAGMSFKKLSMSLNEGEHKISAVKLREFCIKKKWIKTKAKRTVVKFRKKSADM